MQGCAVYNGAANFVGQRYINTISYFNTYYNASRAFSEAESEYIAAEKQAQSKSYTLKPGPVPSTARQKFTTSIEKNSKLLSFYPTCKWVDDALLMIGKSYYYLDDDVKSERKFLELFAKYPSSSLIPEAELWYGKSLLRQKKVDEAIKVLDNLYEKSLQEGEKTIAGYAEFSIGSYYFLKKDYKNALISLQKGMDVSDEDHEKAKMQYYIGLCYDDLAEYEKAAHAFRTAVEYSSDFSFVFECNFQYTRMLSKQQKYGEALQLLEEYLQDSKNSEMFPKIQLEIGLMYLAQDRRDEAIQKLTFVDTTYVRTEEAATAYYALGSLYESKLLDYSKAKICFDKARSENSNALTAPLAVAKSDIFFKYFSLTKELTKYDSLLLSAEALRNVHDTLIIAHDTTLSADTVTQSPLSAKQTKKPTKTQQKKTPITKDTVKLADSTNALRAETRLAQNRTTIDSLKRSVTRVRFELAGLFFLELKQRDSALFWYTKVIEEGTQRDFIPRSMYTLAQMYSDTSGALDTKRDSIYGQLIHEYPESPYAQEARRVLNLPQFIGTKDTAEALFSVAEQAIAKNDFSEALTVLKKIESVFDKSPLAPKALYTIGWLYENSLMRLDSASAVYRRLVQRYPQTPYAVKVLPKINEEDQFKKEEEMKTEAKDATTKEKTGTEEKKDDGKQSDTKPH